MLRARAYRQSPHQRYPGAPALECRLDADKTAPAAAVVRTSAAIKVAARGSDLAAPGLFNCKHADYRPVYVKRAVRLVRIRTQSGSCTGMVAMQSDYLAESRLVA